MFILLNVSLFVSCVNLCGGVYKGNRGNPYLILLCLHQSVWVGQWSEIIELWQHLFIFDRQSWSFLSQKACLGISSLKFKFWDYKTKNLLFTCSRGSLHSSPMLCWVSNIPSTLHIFNQLFNYQLLIIHDHINPKLFQTLTGTQMIKTKTDWQSLKAQSQTIVGSHRAPKNAIVRPPHW